MANNKLYENYLMHYRTKGSKNGYTKYPGKYTPIGEKAIDSTGLNFNRYKNLQRFWTPKDGGEGPAMVADKAQVAVARAEHDRNARRAEARKKMSPLLNSVRATTMVGTSGYIKGKNEQNKRKQNQQAAEARRIKGGNVGGGTTAVQRMIKREEDMHNVTRNVYNAGNAIANPLARSKESQRFTNQKMAEARRIKGGSGISASQRQKEAEARRIAGGSQGTITRAEAARRTNQQAAEQRRIAGGSGISASQRQKEAEARRIAGSSMADTDRNAQYKKKLEAANSRKNASNWYNNKLSGTTTSQDRMREAEARRIKGGSQGAPTANERVAAEKRKNINDWYGNQVRGGNQSAAEARRIAGGTSGTTTTTQAAIESEKKKKKLKKVFKALLKSNSHGISRFL